VTRPGRTPNELQRHADCDNGPQPLPPYTILAIAESDGGALKWS
jgi:hypothetical protein